MERSPKTVIGCLKGENETYVFKKVLGEGGNGRVFLAYPERDHSVEIAIKFDLSDSRKYYEAEVEALRAIDNPNVVKLIDYGIGILEVNGIVQGEIEFIALEFLPNGDFFDYLCYPDAPFGEEFGRLIFIQILNGVEATHNAGFVHRDLKNENIFLAQDYTLKVADFGHAKRVEGDRGNFKLNTHEIGTGAYAPMDIKRRDYRGVPVDIFNLGVLLFMVVFKSRPFLRADKDDPFYKHIIAGDTEGYWKMFQAYSPTETLKDLISSLLDHLPTARPSIQQIKAHPWVAQALTDPMLNQLNNQLKEEFKARKPKVYAARVKTVIPEDKKGGKHVYRGESVILDTKEWQVEDCDPLCRTIVEINGDVETEDLLRSVRNYLKEKKCKVELKKNFNLVAIFDDDDGVNENLIIDVGIKNNDEKTVVQFVKVQGDKIAFNDIFEGYALSG